MYVIVALTLLLQEKSPEETLNAIAGKIDQAKSLTVKMSIEGASRGGNGNSWYRETWTLLLQDENKVRFTIKSQTPAGEREALYVSDGKTTRGVWKRPEGPATFSKETPRNLASSLKKAIVYGGPEVCLMFLYTPEDQLDSVMKENQRGPIRELKLSTNQKELWSLEYKLPPGSWAESIGKTESAESTLTFDPKTLQPLKRYTHSKMEEKHKGVRACPPVEPDRESWSTQTYDELTLNAAISDDTFKLPEK